MQSVVGGAIFVLVHELLAYQWQEVPTKAMLVRRKLYGGEIISN